MQSASVLSFPDMSEMAEHAEAAATLLKSLGNSKRLMVLCVLGDQELSVGDLNAHIPLSQSALSQHLAVMRREELVETRRDGATIYYRVKQGPALGVLQVLQAHFCPPE